jgi:hypothetical protein
VTLDREDQLGHKERQEQLDRQGLLDLQDLLGRRERQEQLDHKAHRATRDQKGQLDQQEQQEQLDHKDRKAYRDHKANKASGLNLQAIFPFQDLDLQDMIINTTLKSDPGSEMMIQLPPFYMRKFNFPTELSSRILLPTGMMQMQTLFHAFYAEKI